MVKGLYIRFAEGYKSEVDSFEYKGKLYHADSDKDAGEGKIRNIRCPQGCNTWIQGRFVNEYECENCLPATRIVVWFKE